LSGLDLIPDPSGALHIPDFATLVIADLHLEKASSLAARGLALPPYDTREAIALLAAVIAAHRPRRVMFLGDSFHDAGGPGRLLADDLSALRRAIGPAEPIWIAGNHDPDFAFDLGTPALSASLGPVTLRHEPQGELGEGECEIAGHLHPVAAVIQRGRRLQRKCFVASSARLVLPAFGVLSGGVNVNSRAFVAVFPGRHFTIWMAGPEAIYRFPASRIC
jgi:hypothetical protein